MKMDFEVEDKKITLYIAEEADAPVVYLNTVQGEGEAVWNACRELACGGFSLAAISGLDWNHDMSPWPVPPLSPSDQPCTGGADAYLKLLTEKIVPEAERRIGKRPAYSVLAGYSLAGLFAVYSAYRTAVFCRFASASGSFWFPGFSEFVQTHPMEARPEKLYFSLGDRESHTRNRVLAAVEEKTEWLYGWYQQQGVDTVFVHNKGNHFKEPVLRMSRGIQWVLGNGGLPGTEHRGRADKECERNE